MGGLCPSYSRVLARRCCSVLCADCGVVRVWERAGAPASAHQGEAPARQARSQPRRTQKAWPTGEVLATQDHVKAGTAGETHPDL